MVAYPAKLSLPYRVSNAWLEERTLAGEIVQPRHSLEVDLDQLSDEHRATATELVKVIDDERDDRWTDARTPVIVGSGIDPAAHVDRDWMDGAILSAIGSMPCLPSPTEDPVLVLAAWHEWVRQYKERAPSALASFIARWFYDESPPDENGNLENGANVNWWWETIGIAVGPSPEVQRLPVIGRDSPGLFHRARGARQLINHARRIVDKSDWALAISIVGSPVSVPVAEPEVVVSAFEAYAKRLSDLAFARHWTGQRHKAGFEQEMVRWANDQGSERLKLGLIDGYRMMPVYLQERIALEVPRFYAHLPGKGETRIWQARTGPSEEALKMRRAVQNRLRTASPFAGPPPEVHIGWIKNPPAAMCDQEQRTEYYGDGDSFLLEDPFEVIVVPDWLGRYVLLAGVWTTQEDQPPDYVLMKYVLNPVDYELAGELPIPPDGLTARAARAAAKTASFKDDDIPF